MDIGDREPEDWQEDPDEYWARRETDLHRVHGFELSLAEILTRLERRIGELETRVRALE